MENEYPERDGNTLKNRERIILLDSSILMHAVKGKKKLPINLEEGLRNISEGAVLAILDKTIEELELLRNKRKGKTRMAADFALEFVQKLKIKIIQTDPQIVEKVKKIGRRLRGYEVHDEILVRMAEKINAAVVTTDFDLVKKLRRRNITCYFLHKKNWIKVSGYQY